MSKCTEHQIDTSYSWCQTLDVSDVDLDGDMDVLTARSLGHMNP